MDLEKEGNVKKKNNLLTGMILGIFFLALGGFLGFYISTSFDNNENKENNDVVEETEDKEEKDPVDENNKEEEKENNEVVEQVPLDSDLIAISKVLINNFGDLLSGGYEYESREYSFSNLKTGVFKLKNQSEIANIIGNTFVDNATAWKYVPYYEEDGIYYGANGSGGFMGAGSSIFEYKVENKTTTTAYVRIEYIECYDEVVPDQISACQTNPWNEVFVIILDLSKVDGKWLISSMDTDMAHSILK